MNITFRYAQLTDLPKIVAIYNQTIKLKNVKADIRPVSVSERKEWFASFSNDSHPLWVLINKEDEIVGWIGLEPFYGRAAYEKTAEISLYLDENYRGQHLGTKTLEFISAHLKKLGIQNIVAFIFKQNTASLNLFKRHFFEEWGFLPQVAQIDENYLDLVIMGRHFANDQ